LIGFFIFIEASFPYGFTQVVSLECLDEMFMSFKFIAILFSFLFSTITISPLESESLKTNSFNSPDNDIDMVFFLSH
jgi:hypothetical protein